MSRTAEKATIGGDDAQEVCGKPCDAGLGGDCQQCLELLIGAEYRAAHQAIEIGAAIRKRVKLIEVLFDGVDGLIVACKLEQGGGVTASHTGDDWIFACH